MKILMVNNITNSFTGGAARVNHFLREEFLRLGHHVDLIFKDDVPDPFGKTDLANITFPILACFKILRTMRTRGRYDVIVLHTLGGAPYVLCRKLFKMLPPCVILSYGGDELRWELEKEEDRLGYRKLNRRSKLLYYNLVVRQVRFAIRNADHVITSSKPENKFYTNRYGINSDRLSFIPNGVGNNFFANRSYSRKPSKLLYLGGWEWRKGIRYLIESFDRVSSCSHYVTLTIAGTGAANGILEQFPAHARPKISLIPRIEPQDLPGTYAAHDIFVLPSLFESIPLVIPEAMASGMPIVTTRTCGIPDVIEDGKTGFLVNPRDSNGLSQRTAQLLKDPELCERLGRAAQEKAKEITWDRIARRTIEVYEEVLNHCSGAKKMHCHNESNSF